MRRIQPPKYQAQKSVRKPHGIQQAFRFYLNATLKKTGHKTHSLRSWRFYRELSRIERTKPHRNVVGLIRALSGKYHIHHGAHHRAEFD